MMAGTLPRFEDSSWFDFQDALSFRDGMYPQHDRTFATNEWTLAPYANKSVQSSRTISRTDDTVRAWIYFRHQITAGCGDGSKFEQYYRGDAALRFVHEFIGVATTCVRAHLFHLLGEMEDVDRENRTVDVEHVHQLKGKYDTFTIKLVGTLSKTGHYAELTNLEAWITVENIQFRDGGPPSARTSWMPMWQRNIHDWSIGTGAALQPHVKGSAEYDVHNKWIPHLVSVVHLENSYVYAFHGGAFELNTDSILFQQRESPFFIGYSAPPPTTTVNR